jgi:hypothetical protein
MQSVFDLIQATTLCLPAAIRCAVKIVPIVPNPTTAMDVIPYRMPSPGAFFELGFSGI